MKKLIKKIKMIELTQSAKKIAELAKKKVQLARKRSTAKKLAPALKQKPLLADPKVSSNDKILIDPYIYFFVGVL